MTLTCYGYKIIHIQRCTKVVQLGCFGKVGYMITLKEYAERSHVSYEAVRKQVTRYKLELDGHISKVKRTQYLDEEAVKFLDSKRQDNPVVIVETEKNERIEQLEAENKALLLKVAELQERVIQEKEKVELLQKEKIELLEDKKQPGLFARLFGKE